jgi:hypothetical protein
MNRSLTRITATALFAFAAVLATNASADFEVTAPDGRRVLLKDNGTWSYVGAADKQAQGSPGAKASAAAPAKESTAKGAPASGASAQDTAKEKVIVEKKPQGELLLQVARKIDTGRNCAFALQLVNKMPYEVGSLVLYFSAYRPDGVLYATETTGLQFGSLRPGNSQVRQVQFQGIGCGDIARVQVSGGDRCTMGELHRMSDQSEHKGKCLERVRVVGSDVVRFEK